MSGPSLALVINLIRELRAYVRNDPDGAVFAWAAAAGAVSWFLIGLFY